MSLFRHQGGSLKHLAKRFMNNSTPRQLLDFTPRKYWNHSARRINSLMRENEFDYLEIGVAYGTTLQAVGARRKVAVDPNPLFDIDLLPSNVSLFKESSDNFFENLDKAEKFHVIFLDGLHESSQLMRDIVNSLRHLHADGWMLIDDVIPCDSISAIPNIDDSYQARGVMHSEGFPWHGDCFRVLPEIFSLDFLSSYLLIYPDNPQLLLRIRDRTSCDKFLDEISIGDIKTNDLDFSEVFSSENLRKMPLFIEELLFRELQLQRES
jgi:Methyltransferase domain